MTSVLAAPARMKANQTRLTVQHIRKLARLFSATHREVGFAAAFSAEFGGEFTHAFTSLMAGLDGMGRAEGDETGAIAEGRSKGNNPFTDLVQDLRTDRTQRFGIGRVDHSRNKFQIALHDRFRGQIFRERSGRFLLEAL